MFLAYIILPVQAGLARRTSRIVGFVLLGLAVAGACALLAALTVRSAANLAEDLPRYTERVKAMTGHVRELADRWPWLKDLTGDPSNAADAGAGWLRDFAGSAAGTAADVVAQSLIVGVYLLFVLLGAAHLPQRIQAGFESARAEQLLAVLARINVAIASYLRAKVLAGLILALPATIILWAFGVKSALFWGVLTFMLSFVPYVGSAIAWTGPTALAFLGLEPGWQPIAVAVLLGADHALGAYLVDPALSREGRGPQPVGDPAGAGILGPVLGAGGHVAGGAPDGRAANYPGQPAGDAADRPDDGGRVNRRRGGAFVLSRGCPHSVFGPPICRRWDEACSASQRNTGAAVGKKEIATITFCPSGSTSRRDDVACGAPG